MRITSKGQVTIPLELREQYGLRAGDEVAFVSDERGLRIVKSDAPPSRGQWVVSQLRGKATANLEMSTDELMAWMRGE